MKKITLLVIATIFSVGAAFAGSPRSIGVRLGTNWDISYQHTLSETNFLTIEAGMPGVAFSKNGAVLLGGASAAVIYDMLDPFGAKFKPVKKGEWHWYMGSGVKGGIYAPNYAYSNPYWHVGFATHLGIEYDFEFPMIIFFDSRATFGATNLGAAEGKKACFDGAALCDLALGLRYKFNTK